MADAKRESAEEREPLPLSKAAENLIHECRIVLPGLQALLGFQLVAVFQTTFSTKLSPLEQQLHLAALGCGAVATAILMTPAAYHRQTSPREVTTGFITLSSRLLMAGMPLIALCVCADFYIIARMVLEEGIAAALVAVVFAVYVVLWFVLPRVRWLRQLLGDATPPETDQPAPAREPRRRARKAH